MGKVTEIKHEKLSNDLFWTAYHSDGDHFERLSWSGYNDGFWWQNVEPTDQFKIRKCKCGKSFRLNEGNTKATEVPQPQLKQTLKEK